MSVLYKVRPLCLLFLFFCLGGCGQGRQAVTTQPGSAAADETKTEPKWMIPLQQITAKKNVMIQDLDMAHKILTERAKREAPELLAILKPKPPKPRTYGYGILPKIEPNGPLTQVKPLQTFYYIHWLETQFDPEYAKARALKEKAQQDATAALKPMVDEYDRLKKRLDLLENHISYHLQWQKAVAEYPEFFAAKNEIVNEVRTVIKYKGDLDALRRDMLPAVAPFVPTRLLKITQDKSGTKILTVPLRTDITNDSFLNTFREAIETQYNDSPAAKAKRFRIALEIKKVAPASLYPDGAPKPGEHIDVKAHVAHFPQDSLVLTTGAESTHAMQGQYIALGPEPITERTLAHEFGHLIGFSDAYLRGYDGNPNTDYGATIVEWTGLYNDLMGNPGGGQVSPLMIDTLIAAYTKKSS